MEDLKKKYEDLELIRQKDSKEAWEEKIAAHKQQMSQLNAQIVELQHELEEVKQNALNDAQMALQNELHSKDIEIRERDAQILNCKETIEDLKRQLSTTQAERKGEAGEHLGT
jgi:chromosome segregation ATPase